MLPKNLDILVICRSSLEQYDSNYGRTNREQIMGEALLGIHRGQVHANKLKVKTVSIGDALKADEDLSGLQKRKAVRGIYAKWIGYSEKVSIFSLSACNSTQKLSHV
jgi:hypothetical protein